MTSTSKIILGLLGATAAGVAIGMLLAPEKGSDLRKKISDKAGELVDKMGDLITIGKEKAKSMASSVSNAAEGLGDDIEEQVRRHGSHSNA